MSGGGTGDSPGEEGLVGVLAGGSFVSMASEQHVNLSEPKGLLVGLEEAE